MVKVSRKLVASIWLCVLMSGCVSPKQLRTDLVNVGDVDCVKNVGLDRCNRITPEAGTDSYELHFVEFDDQGWALKPPSSKNETNEIETQTNHLMTRLTSLLGEQGRNVSVILYVHGWKHDAASSDEDVRKFRKILAASASNEKHKEPNRRVVGIYVGWRGKSWDLPGYLLNGSFWSRKSAAQRVSHGAVQELFSRLRTAQRFYNSFESKGCTQAPEGMLTTGGCRFRMLMIGHSFGAYILYSAVSAPLIATLNAEKDLKKPSAIVADGESVDKVMKRMVNSRPADMVVLINPAFEAVRYQPLHEAARSYEPKTAQAPLLISISSSADTAVKSFFPAGRFFNTLFEKPTTSAEQSEAMAHSHGYISLYQTHELSLDEEHCKNWTSPIKINTDTQLATNAESEADNSSRFFEANLIHGKFPAAWTRPFCGGLKLRALPPLQGVNLHANRNPNTLVWNVLTDASVIGSHTDILHPNFLEFIRQLYEDTDCAATSLSTLCRANNTTRGPNISAAN